MPREIRVVTTDLSKTHKLGEEIGKNLRGDEIFALVSNLGGGKTSFTQGLAKGLKAKGNVMSPTFVLERIYKTKRGLELHHFDLYRIKADEVDSTGLFDTLGEGVVVIEWAEKIKKYLPDDTIWVEIRYKDENTREFKFKFPEDRDYIFKEIPPSTSSGSKDRRSSG